MPAPAERHAEVQSALGQVYRLLLACAKRGEAERAVEPARAAEQDEPPDAA